MQTDFITYDFRNNLKVPPYWGYYFTNVGNVSSFTLASGEPAGITRVTMNENSITGQRYGINTATNPVWLSPNTDYMLRITGYVPDANTHAYAVVESVKKSIPLCNKLYLPVGVTSSEVMTIVSNSGDAIPTNIAVYLENGSMNQGCYIKYIEFGSQTLAGFKNWHFIEGTDTFGLYHNVNSVDRLIALWEDLNP